MASLLLMLFPSFLTNWLSSVIPVASATPIIEQKVEGTCRTTHFVTLMYHHIRDYSALKEEAKDISVSPEEFHDQMDYLSKN